MSHENSKAPEARPTPGRMAVHLHHQVEGLYETPGFSIFTDDGRGNGLAIPCSEDAETEWARDEAHANAALIAEAFNTLHATGLSPRQLADKLAEWKQHAAENLETIRKLVNQRGELLAALKGLVEFCDDPQGSEKPESLGMGLARLLPAARAIIAKAEGGAP